MQGKHSFFLFSFLFLFCQRNRGNTDFCEGSCKRDEDLLAKWS